MINTTVAHYKILSKIGEGGMGEVYRATDTRLNRDVALKILPEQFAADGQRMARFEREAHVLAQLSHPNIEAIHGIEEAGQTKALVLELIEGLTLAERIAQGALPMDEALPIALQIAEALEAAHEKGIVHRDLKPANIKITPEGTVKVLDFGLAKAAEPDATSSPDLTHSPTLSLASTQAGVLLGTAAYMSPEQAAGKTTDKRSDIWSFGVVVFEMLSGRSAFEGETVSHILAHILRGRPDWDRLPISTPSMIRRLLIRCLEKESHDRLRDIGEARIAIQRCLADPSGQEATETAGPLPAAAWRRGLPWALLTVGSLLAAMTLWNPARSEPMAVTRFQHFLIEDESFPGTSATLLAISPDGSTLVYSNGEQLYSRRMDELEARPIQGTQVTLPRIPFFSADGDWVGFLSYTDFKVKRIPLVGGIPVTLSEEADPRFDFAGWAGRDTLVVAGAEGLLRVPASGGSPEQFVPRPELSENFYSPQLLPGGSSVLFDVPVDREIWVLSLGTGERKKVLDGIASAYVPTGHIVYLIQGGLFAVPFDLEKLEVTGGPVALLDGVRPFQYSISDTGTLAYIRADPRNQLRTLALVDRNGAVETLAMPPGNYLSARLSPDATSVAVENRDHIWVYDLAARRAMRQLTLEGNNRRPIWTPDGRHITFSSDRDGTWSLYWQPADGSSGAERLTTAEERTQHQAGSWSPDGSTLAFMIRDPLGLDWAIWTLSIAEGQYRTEPLYDVQGQVYLSPEFSPDGRWLAYASGDSVTNQDVYVEPFPATGRRERISQNGGYWLFWSRNGRELFYRALSSVAGNRLRVVDIETQPGFGFSDERILEPGGFTVVSFSRDYDILPDGEQFLMIVPADDPESGPVRESIIVVQNWFEELKGRVPVN